MDTEKSIKLVNLVNEKNICLELKGRNKKALLEELVDFMAKSSGKIRDKKSFLTVLLKREKLGSTGIGGGVAIPHAKSPKVKNFLLVLARHTSGVDFGALDGEKTYLFFVLISPENNVGGHLKILAEISRLVKDKFIVDLLKKAEDKKEILRVISAYEQ
ncbi:MAG: PTS sugar transporter subunit IIA [Candidatus Omnitrophica bacterium]|nr:PTS sugar transporter subunit IIA [Candidatus Omnitrophota bacterium]